MRKRGGSNGDGVEAMKEVVIMGEVVKEEIEEVIKAAGNVVVVVVEAIERVEEEVKNEAVVVVEIVVVKEVEEQWAVVVMIEVVVVEMVEGYHGRARGSRG